MQKGYCVAGSGVATLLVERPDVGPWLLDLPRMASWDIDGLTEFAGALALLAEDADNVGAIVALAPCWRSRTAGQEGIWRAALTGVLIREGWGLGPTRTLSRYPLERL